jgi:DNA-binding transcriptional LysR family regulator
MFLKDLEYFAAMARTSNIARAAELLTVSQPTVSKALARLERALGVRLFDRLARGVRLTPAGRAFLHYANGAALLLRDAGVEMREYRRGEAGVVRIGVGLAIPEGLLDDAIEAMLDRRPHVRFELRGGMADTLLDALEAGLTDLVVTVSGPQGRIGLRWQTIASDRLVFAAPRGHALLSKPCVTLDDLAAARLILPAPSTLTRGWLEALFANEGKPTPRPFVESHASGRELALALRFNAVTLLPASLLQSPAFEPHLRALKVPTHWNMERPISLVMRHGRVAEHARTMIGILGGLGAKLR